MAATDRARLTRTVQLRFTEDQYARLRDLAAAADMSVGQLVRLVVASQLTDDPQLEHLHGEELRP